MKRSNLATTLLRWHTVLLALAAIMGFKPPALFAATELKPNFVFILADDLGWSDLGCYGADLHETPNIDSLAAQGIRFTDAYAAPVCSPTRASIMAGKHPARLHMTIWHEGALGQVLKRKMIPPSAVANLPRSEITIAEILKAAGYRTFHVGKWHLGDAAHYPETQGFDINIGGTFWGAPNTFFFPFSGSGRFGKQFRYVPGLGSGQPEDYLTDRLTDKALELIDQSGEQPFFLNLWYHTVHTPIEAKAERVNYYARKIQANMNHQNATYAAMVHSLDENVGRVLRKLEARGIAKNTIVIFMSDNGGYINRSEGQRVTNNYPLRSGKGSLYEGGVRVPLIVRWPGITWDSSVSHTPVVSMDLYPTILEMAGLEGDSKHNSDIDGVSLVPILRDPTALLSREDIYGHYPHYYPTTTPVSSIRSGNWKLLEYHEDDRIELYDLENDLDENVNLAASRDDKARELRARLHEWRHSVGAQMPLPNPNRERN